MFQLPSSPLCICEEKDGNFRELIQEKFEKSTSIDANEEVLIKEEPRENSYRSVRNFQVSSHRLLWRESNKYSDKDMKGSERGSLPPSFSSSPWRCLKLNQVSTLQMKGGWLSKKKVFLEIRGGRGEAFFLSIRLESGDIKTLFEVLNSRVSQKSWNFDNPKFEVKEEIGGLARVLKTRENVMRNQENMLDFGLKNVKNLEETASDLVRLAQVLKKLKTENKEDDAVQKLFEDYGLGEGGEEGPLGEGGEDVEANLERICVRILENLKSTKKFPLLLLQDAYCLVNRSLGFEVITPKNFFKILEKNQGKKSIRIERFEEGKFNALTLREFGVSEAVERVESLLLGKPQVIENLQRLRTTEGNCRDGWEGNEEPFRFRVSPAEVSEVFSISLTLSLLILKEAEKKGVLLRDEALEGLHYFRNIL